jgi:hypothetical protein
VRGKFSEEAKASTDGDLQIIDVAKRKSRSFTPELPDGDARAVIRSAPKDE